MFQLLFLIFVIVPIIEIAVLMQVGALIGGWPTVGIVIITAWLGAANVRQQGLSTIQNLQLKMAQGEMPSEEIVAGLLLMVAGVFLVTPGFVTDALGLSLLIPVVRKSLINKVQKHLVSGAVNGTHFNVHTGGHQNQNSPFSEHDIPHKERQGQTLDGEYERKD